MAVGKRARFEIFKRDGFACQYCGRTPPAVVLEPDHIVPVSAGGPDDMLNLVTACFDCNRGKAAVPLTSVPAPLAETMEAIAERREQLEAFNRLLMERREVEDGRIHELGVHWFNKMLKPRNRGKYAFNDDDQQSIRTFLRRLPYAQVLESMDLAGSRVPATFDNWGRRWKYFCAVCWTKIRVAEGA
jgi:hypothetical protein